MEYVETNQNDMRHHRIRSALERFIVACANALINGLYTACLVFPRKDNIIFVSRQTNDPSRDFLALGSAFKDRGFQSIYLTKKLSKRTAAAYLLHAVREIYHLARCRACFVDRYDPVISLVNLKCAHVILTQEDKVRGVFDAFPIEPVVIQLWHAFGAFKKFGYQSHDTLEGHALCRMELYKIHRNYSWVLCSGEGAKESFAQAFRYPTSRVVALPRPEYDNLKLLAEEKVGAARSNKVLFAPTLRKSEQSLHPFRDLYISSEWSKFEKYGQVSWVFHPLEQTGFASGSTGGSLLEARIVVTDYSSVAYEASLLGKEVLFYVPDIQTYCKSPGLNTNPLMTCPNISFINEHDLFVFIEKLLSHACLYPREELAQFVRATVDQYDENVTEMLVVSVLRWISGEKDFKNE